MKAINIKWNIDLEKGETYEMMIKELNLPNDVEIPCDINDEDDISDYLSDAYGFCHYGFELMDDRGEII